MAKSLKAADAFTQAVERALEHVHDPQWLGNESALAAPYFIGAMLDPGADSESPAGRGQALAAALRAAASPLPAAQRMLLDVSFFQRDRALNNTGVSRALNLSEPTYYRHRAGAIDALANALNQAVAPPLRVAAPQPRPIVNRERVLSQCTAALRDRHSVSITGAGGLGKTTLGAHLSSQWPQQRAFWFTVRPGLNDHLSSVVFSLGHFLRSLGAASAWRQLVADRGTVDATRVLGLIRHDLGALGGTPVMMCVDDADLLRQERREHAQIIHLLEELSDSTALLVIGQQPVAATQHHHLLSGLTAKDISSLLLRDGAPDLSGDELAQLRTTTRGNPALIRLFVSLLRAGDRPADVLTQLANAPSVEVLLSRMWKRLDEDARALLMALSIFRGPAPQDAWAAQRRTLEGLIARDLLELDGHGGIVVPGMVQAFAERRIIPEQRQALHLAGAEIREMRGEFTAAAYHYLAARQPALAVWTWYNHRELEAERGNAPAAFELFRDVADDDLDHEDDRRALAILRTEQLLRVGAGDEAAAVIRMTSWPAAHPLSSYAQQLQGDVLRLQGRVEQALATYRSAVDSLEPSADRRIVQLRAKIGHLYVSRLRNLDLARREASLALWQANVFAGIVEEEASDYVKASAHYEAALAIAESLEHNLATLAHTHAHLGHLSWRQGHAAAAIRHLEQAIELARHLGDLVSVTYSQLNLSSAHIVDGRHEQALAVAQTGLGSAEALKDAFLIAGLSAAAGEACFYLRRLDEAEQFAVRSLREEEELHRPYALTVLGWVHGARGQPEQAERMLRAAIEGAQETQDKFAEAPAWKALAETQRALGRRDDARAAYDQAHALYVALHLDREAQAVAEAAAMP